VAGIKTSAILIKLIRNCYFDYWIMSSTMCDLMKILSFIRSLTAYNSQYNLNRQAMRAFRKLIETSQTVDNDSFKRSYKLKPRKHTTRNNDVTNRSAIRERNKAFQYRSQNTRFSMPTLHILAQKSQDPLKHILSITILSIRRLEQAKIRLRSGKASSSRIIRCLKEQIRSRPSFNLNHNALYQIRTDTCSIRKIGQ
jgi:hypothetical protein